MRWFLLLLGLTTCCMARSMPVIPLGTSPKEVELGLEFGTVGYFTPWESFVVGEVMTVTSQAHQSASEIRLEESCTMRLEAMYGTTTELADATILRLADSYVHDTYQQVAPDWGVCRHLKKGQRVLVLTHRWGPEEWLVVGPHAVIVLNEKTQTLPDILRRTRADASRFTSADLAVLKEASPFFYDEVVMIAEVQAEIRSDEAASLNQLVGVCMALFFGVILCVDIASGSRMPCF